MWDVQGRRGHLGAVVSLELNNVDDNACLADLGSSGEVMKVDVTERARQLKWWAEQKQYGPSLRSTPKLGIGPSVSRRACTDLKALCHAV